VLHVHRYISVYAPLTGKSANVKVVDECDSVNGCDSEHAFLPPCKQNIVDASLGVWLALGIKQNNDNFGEMPVFWHDA
jgi:hypothetical protein